MNPERLMTQTATIVRRAQTGPADAFGDPTLVETSSISKCALFAAGSTEDNAGAQITTENLRLFLPADADVEAIDGITVDGITYEIEGAPWHAWNPRLRRYTHYEAAVRRSS